jgi:hypothetical protein
LRFDYAGYTLKFVQQNPCRDNSAHQFTRIYKFYSPITKYIYILHADYHRENIFALKFYAKQHRHSDYKYSKLTNKGDVANILITCLKAIPLLLKDYPDASFGFIGARTIDKISKTVESYNNTQRFRVYKYVVEQKIGFSTFEHYIYEAISGYLLINKAQSNTIAKEKAIIEMLAATYQNLVNI